MDIASQLPHPDDGLGGGLHSVHSGYTSGPYFGKLLAQAILGAEPELPPFPITQLMVKETA